MKKISKIKLPRTKRPKCWINPYMKKIKIRDQGERACSVSIATAYCYDLLKEKIKDEKEKIKDEQNDT